MKYCIFGGKLKNSITRKQPCIMDHLFAQTIGRQTHYGLTEKPPKIEDFFQKVMGYVFLLFLPEHK